MQLFSEQELTDLEKIVKAEELHAEDIVLLVNKVRDKYLKEHEPSASNASIDLSLYCEELNNYFGAHIFTSTGLHAYFIPNTHAIYCDLEVSLKHLLLLRETPAKAALPMAGAKPAENIFARISNYLKIGMDSLFTETKQFNSLQNWLDQNEKYDSLKHTRYAQLFKEIRQFYSELQLEYSIFVDDDEIRARMYEKMSIDRSKNKSEKPVEHYFPFGQYTQLRLIPAPI